MKLLIVKTSSMGDVVHALPVVADLHRWRGDLEIDWLVEPPFAPIVELHPGVSKVHRLAWRKWRKSLWKGQTRAAIGSLRQTVREARYDLVLDLQGLLKSALWARQAGAPVAGYDAASAREPLASLLYRHRHAVPRQAQAVWRCRELAARALGAPTPATAADFGLGTVQPLPGLPPYAVLIPNASRPEKLWPEGHWIEVGRTLAERGLACQVLWGSAAEEAAARRIAQGCGAQVPPFLTVADAARLLAGAQVVVGLDTGFSHLAAALGRPVVGVYCDHEPGLAGLTGSGPLRCLGGKGSRPGVQEVLGALREVWA